MCPCAPYRGIFPGAVADDSVAPRVPVSPLGDIVHLALYHQPLVRPQVVLLDLLPGVEGDLRLALPRLLAFLPPFPHGAGRFFVFWPSGGGPVRAALARFRSAAPLPSLFPCAHVLPSLCLSALAPARKCPLG